MRIREIIFQGVFASSSPVRLATAPGVDRMALPRGLGAADIQALLIALFYPARMPEDIQREFAGTVEVKLAVVFEQAGQAYRLLRKNDPDSLRLQVDEGGGFRPLATGAAETAHQLNQTIGLPSFETFAALNLWRFHDDPLYQKPEFMGNEAGRREYLIEQYRAAIHLEGLEDKIKALQAEIDTQRAALGKGAELEDKLERARAKLERLRVDGLTEQDLALLNEKDQRFKDYDQLFERLAAEEEQERWDLERSLPEKPWTTPAFGLSILFGLIAIGVSIGMDGPFRPVAALNVFAMGVAAWILLKYYTDLERASVHQVRMDSIKRRLNQVREEEVTYRERLNHMMIHAGLSDEAQLLERMEKSAQLEQIVQAMEERAHEMRADPEYRAARQRIEALSAELQNRQDKRATLPHDMMSSFQLEDDLRALGVDPRRALQEDPKSQPEELPQTLFGRLKLAAEKTGQWRDGQLEPRTRKMWGKICAHILSERFKDVDLTSSGELRIGEMSVDQLQMWQRTRGSEEWSVGLGLALALHVNTAERARGFMETIWVQDPRPEMGADGASALDEVLASAAKMSHIVLCTA